MTDRRLQTLKRAWLETGTVEAEADYLLARVRAGDLRQDRLELAEFLEHPAAYVAIHGVLPKALRRRAMFERIIRDYEDERWRIAAEARRRMDALGGGWIAKNHPTQLVCNLRPFGKQACVRAAIVATRRVVYSPNGGPVGVPLVLDLVERWATWPAPGAYDASILRAVIRTTRASPFPIQVCAALGRAAVGRKDWKTETRKVVGQCTASAASAVLSKAIRRELIPWALGRADPVAVRIRDRDEGA